MNFPTTMDSQANRSGRRRRRRKNQNKKPAAKVEPIVVAARRPDSPRLEKPTRRMKAASAKPRTLRDDGPRRHDGPSLRDDFTTDGAEGNVASNVVPLEDAPKKRREARIVVRREDEVDDTERNRRRLLSRYMAAEGRAAITKAADEYFKGGFMLPNEQEAQLKLLEHFDELRSAEAVMALAELIQEDPPQQLPVLRQRLRRLEDHAEDATLRHAAGDLRRRLPA